jgi:uncharacterized integral membrane protein
MKTGFVLFLLLLVTVVVVQNTEVVTFRFLFWEFALSRVLLLLLTFLAGSVLGYVLAKLRRNPRGGQRTESRPIV